LVEEQAHLGEQIRAASENLDRLSHTNVFDDAFHISWDGHFATINGFRLGRLPSQPVEWAEISAALGQALLLLATMARQTEYKFQKSEDQRFFPPSFSLLQRSCRHCQRCPRLSLFADVFALFCLVRCCVAGRYRLIPMGSYSKLCRADDPSTTYELYGSNDLILGRLFWYRRFDQALVWLLACIQEFAEFAHAQDKAFTLKYPYVPTVRATVESKLQWRCSKYRRYCLPISHKLLFRLRLLISAPVMLLLRIHGDLIGGQSIKLQFNNDRAWSKALKYMLINLKFMLGWTARRMATSKQ
jgi:beclin 1